MKADRTFASVMAFAFLAFAILPAPAQADPPHASAQLAGHRLQQVAVTTKDLTQAIAFYRDTLGLPFLFESNDMAFFDLAGTRLMIATDRERPDVRPGAILYFDAAEFELTLARLKAAKVPLDGPVETVQRTVEGELKLQQFSDPDGNALAIIGTVPR
jgi:methylmalonyl-CoA/ethylmalonyl-CoA epimerase